MSRLLRLLLRLFPRPFRRRFEGEMWGWIQEGRARARRRGRLALLRVDLATATDLLTAAAAEHLAPSWEGRRDLNDHGGWRMTMGGWIRDLRLAGRSLSRVPAFTAVAVLTLALALGVNAGLFSVVETVLLRPLPYHEPDRLVEVASTAPGTDFPPEFGVGPSFYLQYRDGSTLLEEVAIYDDFTQTVRWGDEVGRRTMVMGSPSLFATLGVPPLLGRMPGADDHTDVAVLSHGFWTEWFGQDPEVVGTTLWAAGAERTVIAVMGPDFWFPYEGVDLWIPMPREAADITPGDFGSYMVARVGPDVDHGALVAELDELAARIPERFGGSPAFARLMTPYQPVVRPLEEELLGAVATPLWILLGSVAVVLLIACANVANLFLARAAHRRRDMAVRAALGAGRGGRIRVLLSEAGVVAMAAAVLAVALAALTLPLLVRAAPATLPRLGEVGISPATVLYTFLAALGATLACGLVPALQASSAGPDELRNGARGSTDGGRRGRNLLVVGQTALALVLLLGSGLLLRSFLSVSRVDPGYDTEDLFSFQMAPDQDHLVDGPSYRAFHESLQERLSALPGVEAVGMVENLPLDEGLGSGRFVPTDREVDPTEAPFLSFTFADADYFGAMGVDVLRGRTFRPPEEAGEEPAVLASASAAELVWPGEDPVGKRLRAAEGETVYTVVGVVEDILQYDLRQEPDPMLYFTLVGPTPSSWMMPSPAHVLRTSRAGSMAPEVRALVREVAPEAPMYRVYTMEALARESRAQLAFTLLTLGLTSLLALFLGAVGLFGVLSYTVAQRTREIGVRMALGADPGRVRLTVMREATAVVLVGVVVGLAAGFALTRVMEGLLFGVEPADALTFGGTAVVMVAVGLLAGWLPSWRASRVHPAESLRAG